MTPAPQIPHRLVVGELDLILRAACPDGLRVLLAPVDVRLSPTTVLQPDLLREGSFAVENLPGAPLLAVEVLSPSTRHIELGLKRSRYEAAGCTSSGVVDPDVPSLIAVTVVPAMLVA